MIVTVEKDRAANSSITAIHCRLPLKAEETDGNQNEVTRFPLDSDLYIAIPSQGLQLQFQYSTCMKQCSVQLQKYFLWTLCIVWMKQAEGVSVSAFAWKEVACILRTLLAIYVQALISFTSLTYTKNIKQCVPNS